MTTDEGEVHGAEYPEDIVISASMPRDEDPEEHAYVGRLA